MSAALDHFTVIHPATFSRDFVPRSTSTPPNVCPDQIGALSISVRSVMSSVARSMARPAPARFEAGSGPGAGGSVRFEAPEYGVSPGQACVFYDGAAGQARVLGGGFIRAAAATARAA